VVESPTKRQNGTIKIVAISIVSAFLVGGAVFAYQQVKIAAIATNANEKISQLTKQVAMLEESNQANNGTSSTATINEVPAGSANNNGDQSETAVVRTIEGGKTYTNATYGFSFQYPAAWSISPPASSLVVSTNEESVDGGPSGGVYVEIIPVATYAAALTQANSRRQRARRRQRTPPEQDMERHKQ